MGDSHTRIFHFINKISTTKEKFIVKLVMGATALGLVNPNSISNALLEYREFLKKVNKKSKIIFLLGEVDAGFLIWHRSEKKGLGIDDQLHESLNNYISFIKECILAGYKNIYVLSIPLPTISDGQNWGEIANKRKEVKASQLERTSLTLKYNNLLKDSLKKLNVQFIEMDNDLLSPQNGLIKDEFINKNKLDHHLERKLYADIIQKALQQNNVIHMAHDQRK